MPVMRHLAAAMMHLQPGRWTATEAVCPPLRLAPERLNALSLLEGVLLDTRRTDEALAVLQGAARVYAAVGTCVCGPFSVMVNIVEHISAPC